MNALGYGKRILFVLTVLFPTIVSSTGNLAMSQEASTAEEAPSLVFNLWPGIAPGENKELPAESDTSGPDANQVAGRSVIRLGNVSTPQIEIFRPNRDIDTGASVVICPGGGYYILAYDLEGTEVARWLNSIGVTGIVLKYRVPAREPGPRWKSAVADTQRAMSLVRSNAKEWKLNPEKIGILGFSAGGHAAALTSSMIDRQYQPIDEVDKVSFQPNFSVLIYPAYLADSKTGIMVDDLKLTMEVAPVFLVHAFDDPVTPLSSLTMASELKKLQVPTEVHMFSEGGHGYGLRETELPITGWPKLCEAWLRRTLMK